MENPALLHKRNTIAEANAPLPVKTGDKFAFLGFLT
jgi:hypothetical protein